MAKQLRDCDATSSLKINEVFFMSSLRKEGQFYRPQANTFPSNKNILKVQLCNWNFQKAFSNSILGIIQVHLQKKSEVHTNNTSKKAMKKAFKVALTATKYIKVSIKLQQVGSNQRPAFSDSLKSEKYLELQRGHPQNTLALFQSF